MNRITLLSSIAVAALATFISAPQASACGGFFCNNALPVNQAAERIIFAQAPDGSITAVIEIQYSGPSESFAWMLPVVGSPDIAVSSNTAFQNLQNATNPQYQLTTRVEGTCRDGGGFGLAAGPPRSADSGAEAGGNTDDDVTVVDAGNVGPYDFVVISVDPGAMDPAQRAAEWLTDNGYDVADFGVDRLAPYLEGGMNLLAFRLSKGNDAGSIRPVILSFGTGLPSIPLRPTAVAAEDDMGVMVWVLGESRAVPANYLSLELNESLINWLNPGANYNDVVTQAANEAGGQGFVTEMAGDAPPLADAVYPPWVQSNWADIVGQDWDGRHGALLERALGAFLSFDGMRDVVRETVPLPDDVTLDELLGCPWCYYGSALPTVDGFSPEGFLAAVQADVIDPLDETAALFRDIPYVTRLYTTLSSDEMTMDPVFDFNPGLGDYSNVHQAERVIECSPSLFQSEAPWRVELPDGTTVRGEGQLWPLTLENVPANRVVRRVGNEGVGEVVTDNTVAIATAVESSNRDYPTPQSGAFGCAVGGPDEGAPLAGLGLLFALGLVLRRRRARA
ncbi:MAG: DUF2330 domain-containing protein [Sandaracinaceae bacterium]